MPSHPYLMPLVYALLCVMYVFIVGNNLLQTSRREMLEYLLNAAIALDQLANAVLLGSPDETLSSRAYRADRDGKVFGRFFRPVIDTIFFWQDRHCYLSYLAEVQRRQLSGSFR